MTTTTTAFDVIVIGGGPAGSTIATRLGQLGHSVCIVERYGLKRHHVGESLSPGIWSQLQLLGATEAFKATPYRLCNKVRVRWPGQPEENRQINGQPGVLVNRSEFDSMLLHFAIGNGVHCLSDSLITEQQQIDGRWQFSVKQGQQDQPTLKLNSAFVVDASGRATAMPGEKSYNGPKTFCLYGYWQGNDVPSVPTIQGTPISWVWGMALPDNTFNAMVFVDELQLKQGAVRDLYHDIVRESGLFDVAGDIELIGKIRTCDATPYISLDPVSDNHIRVGEAALALDPLSSSGVQKAIHTALSGAIAVHTLLKNPLNREAAKTFYRDSLDQSALQHKQWAQDFYGTGASFYNTPFWQTRAQFNREDEPEQLPFIAQPVAQGKSLILSPELKWAEVPCITGEFIELYSSVEHPAFDQPVAFYSGHALAPLLKSLPAKALKPIDIATLWESQLGLHSALSLVGWLMGHGLMVAA
ncbi:MAG: hypothetical protein ACI9FJ_000765 [Alteromonadaceae bacterium]|jgi:hypothetical protein